LRREGWRLGPGFRPFTPPSLHFAAPRWLRPAAAPRLASSQAFEAVMTPLIESLGPNLPVVFTFLGVLVLSLATAVIAILADS